MKPSIGGDERPRKIVDDILESVDICPATTSA